MVKQQTAVFLFFFLFEIFIQIKKKIKFIEFEHWTAVFCTSNYNRNHSGCCCHFAQNLSLIKCLLIKLLIAAGKLNNNFLPWKTLSNIKYNKYRFENESKCFVNNICLCSLCFTNDKANHIWWVYFRILWTFSNVCKRKLQLSRILAKIVVVALADSPTGAPDAVFTTRQTCKIVKICLIICLTAKKLHIVNCV